MRKTILVLAFIFCLSIQVSAEEKVDLSGLSLEELQALQSQVNQALWECDGWQEVEVPVGVYKVGEDIPAGRWTVSRAYDKYTYLRVGNAYDNGEVHSYTFTEDLETDSNITVDDGQYIEISHYPVIFTPYVAAFSFK